MIKVTFKAKIKKPTPPDFLDQVRHAAKQTLGFIQLKVIIQDQIETAISYWKTQEAIQLWAKNPIHLQAKKQQSQFYEWIEVSFEEVEEKNIPQVITPKNYNEPFR